MYQQGEFQIFLFFQTHIYNLKNSYIYRNQENKMQIEQYLGFTKDLNQNYKLSSKLFSRSKVIRPKFRAKLFQWLSQQCAKQQINRYAFVLTCYYLDLYFMRGFDVKKREDYQYLALGALILACKQVQKQGKFPIINTRLISANTILQMQNNIVTKLDYFLNPPNYIQILHNIAKIWDIKWNKESKYSSIRFLQDNISSYKKMKIYYEILDCLNLFHEMLDFDIFQTVLTIFYVLTKQYYLQELNISSGNKQISTLINSRTDQFQVDFIQLLKQYQIKTKINNQIIEKAFFLLNLQTSSINQSISYEIITNGHFFQTYNIKGYRKAQIYYQKQQQQNASAKKNKNKNKRL